MFVELGGREYIAKRSSGTAVIMVPHLGENPVSSQDPTSLATTTVSAPKTTSGKAARSKNTLTTLDPSESTDLESTGRAATPVGQNKLVNYSGWGWSGNGLFNEWSPAANGTKTAVGAFIRERKRELEGLPAVRELRACRTAAMNRLADVI